MLKPVTFYKEQHRDLKGTPVSFHHEWVIFTLVVYRLSRLPVSEQLLSVRVVYFLLFVELWTSFAFLIYCHFHCLSSSAVDYALW